jgi:hypothetical protein
MAKRPHPRESARALEFERVESRDTPTPAVVDVSVASGVLTIAGDANNDRLIVTQDHAGDYVIRAGANTTLTAGAGVTLDHRRVIVPVADNITSANVDFGAGNNSLSWMRGNTPAAVTITGGDGNNSVLISGVRGDSDLSVTLGGGINRLILQNSKVGDLTFAMGTSSSANVQTIGVSDCWITGATNITTGAGEDRVFLGSINNSYGDGFDGDVNVNTGAANDMISVDGSVFNQNLTLNGGTAFNEGFGAANIRGNATFIGMAWNEIFLDGVPYYQYVPSP